MKWLTFKIQRTPGFRFNLTDFILIALLIGVTLGWRAVFPVQDLYLLPIYVGGSFLLFCNVFRIGNRLEVPWYLTFVALTTYGFSQTEFPWLLLLSVCEALKWALIGYKVRRGPYVGAFHQQLDKRRAA